MTEQSIPADSRAPCFLAPPGACDTHMHIYDRRFPFAPATKITFRDTPVSEYLHVRKRLGISRTVVVQPSAYGTDNRCTLDAMAQMQGSARGVAVVDASVTDAELRRLTDAGIRGIRYFMLPGGILPWESLEAMAGRVAAFGWHVQLQLDGRNLPEREGVLKRLPGLLVIDHVGKFLEPVPVDHPGVQTLLRLLDGGRTYVKLSAPYETSKSGPPYFDDVGKIAKTLAKAAPERMLWASNWPHPTPNIARPNDADLLDVLLDWLPDEPTRQLALVDNAARLYGF